jgi:hypothetical protein
MDGIYGGLGVGLGLGVGVLGDGLSGGWWGDDKSSKTGGFGSVSPFVPEYKPSKTQKVFGARNAGTS